MAMREIKEGKGPAHAGRDLIQAEEMGTACPLFFMQVHMMRAERPFVME